MTHVDLLILLFIGYFALRGLFQGFFREIFRIIGFLLGLWLAFLATPEVSPVLQTVFPSAPAFLVSVFSFLLIFAMVVTASKVVASLLSFLFQKIHLGWLNRLLGFTVGAARGAIMLGVIFLFLSFLPFTQIPQTLRENSKLYLPLQGLVPLTYNLIVKITPGSRDFEEQFSQILQESKIKITREALRYFLYGKNKQESNN